MCQRAQDDQRGQPWSESKPIIKLMAAKSAAALEAAMPSEEREFSHRYVKVLSSDFQMAKVFEETITVEDVKELKED